MEPHYMVRGADGGEYGPATLEQLDGWIRDGRVNEKTEIRRSDREHWEAAGRLVELHFSKTPQVVAPLIPPAASPAATASESADPIATKQMKSGASWFYWIAALSLLNSLVALSGSDWGFILGLGVTQVIGAIGQQFATAGQVVSLVLSVLAIGLFVLFGFFAHRGHTWSFVVGMILYAFDGVIFILAQDWLGVGFHGFVLFCLFRGLTACRELRAR